jgi:hypothetical protein
MTTSIAPPICYAEWMTDVVQRATGEVTAPAPSKKQKSGGATSSPAVVARRSPKRKGR